MKLLFCLKCQDVFKLPLISDINPEGKHCECGKCYGYYKSDGLNAVVDGPCEVLGLSNSSLKRQLENKSFDKEYILDCTYDINAWIIKDDCETVVRRNR